MITNYFSNLLIKIIGGSITKKKSYIISSIITKFKADFEFCYNKKYIFKQLYSKHYFTNNQELFFSNSQKIPKLQDDR